MFGLYFHIPFCMAKCGYCSFSSRPLDSIEQLESLRKNLLQEASLRLDELKSEPIATIYFGGGTPSLLSGESISSILDGFRDLGATLHPGAEITLEINPETVREGDAFAWRQAAINRVSLGAQSFAPPALAFLERRHRPQQLIEALQTLRSAEIDNVSLDLIVGLPQPYTECWEEDVRQALALSPEHLSVYLLSADAPSRLHARIEEGLLALPDGKVQSEVFVAVHDRLTAAGFEHYEVSSFAKPGRRSRHNSAYWTGRPYVGIGPAAHSFTMRHGAWVRSANEADPEAYAAKLNAGRLPIAYEEIVTPEMARLERLMLGLRTSEGVGLEEIDRSARSLVDRFVEEGLVVTQDGKVRPTPEGMLHADGMAMELSG